MNNIFEELNPECKIIKIGKLKLIQEHDLIVGTKQRGIKFFQNLKDTGYEEVVAISSVFGYGQIAVAFACKIVNLKCTIFVSKSRPVTNLTKKALAFSANIIEVNTWHNYDLTEKALEYVENKENIKFLPLGLDDDEFMDYLYRALIKSTKNVKPRRMWLAVGSGVILRTLVRIWPNCEYLIVQVGRNIPDHILEGIKYIKYVYPSSFSQKTQTIPPYESLSHYDAKVWHFASKFGEKGDYIWNVK